ncbi:hypothetical protein [Streptomyces indicus]|uniref:HTH cro/C1-type domain-containing protein n=1 Tax=Streptomyces indicus TaxID=417292 RepID=A0A1G9F249_9ACTN|nr:hypothetical protein [Streptomyces indicus]SDK82442.1 hypothetical protein SAMN05421806_112186 [Streptomyces indicus]
MTTTVANERLRGAMVAANVTIEGLAAHLGMDPKSVERWMTSDRTPHARNAHAAAKLLHTDPYHLWPDLDARHRSTPTPRDELVTCYPMRGAVPHNLWRSLIEAATSTIDLAVSNAMFLADAVWDLPRLLTQKASAGVRVRIAAAPTDRRHLATLPEVFPSLVGLDGIRLVAHDGLSADVLRADDDLLVSAPLDGTSPALAPVLHLRRLGPAPLVGGYLTTLDHVFAASAPWSTPARLAVVA